MEIEIPLLQGLSLKIGTTPDIGNGYPTARLQKGFLLFDEGIELAEEAVGFGVPVLKRGLHTIFPGSAAVTCLRSGSAWNISTIFTINLVERISRRGRGNVESRPLYAAKNLLAAAIRRLPWSRRVLTGISSGMRGMFNWETDYAEADLSCELKLVHTVEESGKISVEIDTHDLPRDITEVVVMNEQGARHFSRYSDASGISLREDEIGPWDEVRAEKAWFEDSIHRVLFRLSKAQGSRLFRGRELIGSRLAWAGFGYSFPPSTGRFRYEMWIERST